MKDKKGRSSKRKVVLKADEGQKGQELNKKSPS
jgi:hypothetical protein